MGFFYRRGRRHALGALITIFTAGPALASAPAASPSSARSNAGCSAVTYRVADRSTDLDESSGGHFTTPPNPDGPTLADLSLFIIDVTGVDEIAGTFTVEAFLDLVWCDPRLAFASEAGTERQTFITGDAALKLDQIWWPDLLIANASSGRQVEKQILELSADGSVEYQERFTATLENNFELRRFPFDRQTLPIVIESFAWSSAALIFHSEGDKLSFDSEFEIPEWHTASVRTRIDSKPQARDRAPFSRLVLEIEVRRQAAFYIWKVLIPLVLLVAVSWSVFWMENENLAERLGVSLTGILTVVAYQFIVADYLPRISYLTFMDAVLFTSFAMMVLTIVENVWAKASSATDSQAGDERMRRFDKTCRWLFPTVYGGLLVILALTYL